MIFAFLLDHAQGSALIIKHLPFELDPESAIGTSVPHPDSHITFKTKKHAMSYRRRGKQPCAIVRDVLLHVRSGVALAMGLYYD